MPPTTSELSVGKHVGEEPNNSKTRTEETIGYIVLESSLSGTDHIEGISYVAAVGSDIVRGTGNAPAYEYNYSALTNANTAIATQAGMDGYHGSWAVLYGRDPITPTGSRLRLAVDEDQARDSERRHTTEQVAFLILDAATTPKAILQANLPVEQSAFESLWIGPEQPSSAARPDVGLPSPAGPLPLEDPLALASTGPTAPALPRLVAAIGGDKEKPPPEVPSGEAIAALEVVGKLVSFASEDHRSSRQPEFKPDRIAYEPNRIAYDPNHIAYEPDRIAYDQALSELDLEDLAVQAMKGRGQDLLLRLLGQNR